MTFDSNVIERFKSEVLNNSEVDPTNDEEDWASLALGWCLAQSMSVEDAYEYADYLACLARE